MSEPTSDDLIESARHHHLAAAGHEAAAAERRAMRDSDIRALRSSTGMSYRRIAAAVDCSPELIRWIITGDRTRKR